MNINKTMTMFEIKVLSWDRHTIVGLYQLLQKKFTGIVICDTFGHQSKWVGVKVF